MMGVSETSREARKEILKEGLPVRQRERIYELLRRLASPATSAELQEILGMRLSSLTARLNCLCASQCVALGAEKRNPITNKMNQTYYVFGPYRIPVNADSEKAKLMDKIESLEKTNEVLHSVNASLRERLGEKETINDGQQTLFKM